MIIAVYTKKDLDYDLNLVAHSILGFDEEMVKRILKIEDEMKIITLINL